jgi:hypothetical protein
MTKTYKATVEGQIRNVKGFDDKQNLELTDGRYTFERLNYNPPGQPPDEPTGDVFSWPLLEVARLRRENDDWYLNDEILPLEKWMQLE